MNERDQITIILPGPGKAAQRSTRIGANSFRPLGHFSQGHVRANIPLSPPKIFEEEEEGGGERLIKDLKRKANSLSRDTRRANALGLKGG